MDPRGNARRFRMPMLDCIIPAHAKDISRLKRCVACARTNIADLGTISIVTAKRNFGRIREELAGQDDGSIQLVSEAEFLPFWHVGSLNRDDGWLLQQLIKLEGARLARTEHYLALDSDVLFLSKTSLFDAAGHALFAVDPPRTKFEAHPIGLACHSFCSIAHHFLGSEFKIHEECYICHHMVFHKPRVRELLRSLGNPRHIYRKLAPVYEPWSEYDFYAQLIKRYYPQSFRVRRRPWLDVPWSGEWDGPLLDSFLKIFADAGVEFVAIHHHFDTRLSVDECFDFAAWATDRIHEPDTRGRWPLFRYLSMKAEERAASCDVSAPCYCIFNFLFEALYKALTMMGLRYAHVREGRSFRASPAMYSESALRDLESDVRRWREAVSLCVEHVLGPALRARLSDRRWKRIQATFDKIDSALVSVDGELSRGPSDVLRRNRISSRIDLLSGQWHRFRKQVKDSNANGRAVERDVVPDAELERHWQGLDERSLSAMVSFGARWVPAPVSHLSRVIGPDRFEAMSHLLCKGPTAETFPERCIQEARKSTHARTKVDPCKPP